MKKQKQFLFAILIIVISYVASFIVSFVSLHSVISDNSKQITNVIAERIHDAINDELLKPIAVSRTIARNLFLIERVKQEKDYDMQKNIDDFAAYLGHVRECFGYESTFLVSEYSRYYYTHAGLNKKMDESLDPHDIWYSAFVEHNKEYELNVDEDQTKQDSLTIFINTRIEDWDGTLIGVCGMGVQMDNLLKMVRENEERFNVDINLVDGNGLVLVDTDKDNIEHTTIDEVSLTQSNNDEYVFKMDGESMVGARYVENLSWFLVIRTNKDFDNGAYSRMLVIYLIVLLVLVVILLTAIYYVMKRDKALFVSSSIDALTGLSTRRAYEDDMKELAKHPHSKITYVSLDLNGLKRVNDNIGHHAGDELIIAAGHFIRDYFTLMGRCYRIGGDEFAVVIRNCDVNPAIIVSEFKALVARWHGHNVGEMSISVGVARSCDYSYEELKKLVEFADMEMYKDKQRYYQEKHITR